MNFKYLTAASVLVLMVSFAGYAADTTATTTASDGGVTKTSDDKSVLDGVKEGLTKADEKIRETLGDIHAYFVDKNKAPGEKLEPVLIQRSRTFHGMLDQTVVNPAGEKVATLEDIIIDNDGTAILAVVSDGGILGIGDKVAAFDYSKVISQKSDGKVVIALNAREHRTVGQKLDDAVANLDEGVDNAARELKDRTPAEKIKDAVDDVKD